MASVYIADGDTQLGRPRIQGSAALRAAKRDGAEQLRYVSVFGRPLQRRRAASEDRRERSVLCAPRPGLRKSRLHRAEAESARGCRAVVSARIDAERSCSRAAHLELAEMYFKAGDFPRCKQYFDSFNSMAQPTSRSLWLGVRLSRVLERPGSAVQLCAGIEEPVPRFAGIPSLSGSRLVSDAPAGRAPSCARSAKRSA